MASYQIVHDLLVGFPAADTGVAYFYSPGTTTPIVIYGDSSGTAQTNPVTLDSNGAARVYLSQLARMIVQDANGATVWDGTINAQQDATVATTSTAFSAATLKAALDTALTKFGGQDFQYVPSGSWVGMPPKSWMNGVVRNVMAYGSVGATSINDGVTPADTALAAAIADAQANGATDVFLPPGTFLLNSPCSINTTGVTIRGAGTGATTIKINSGTNNGLAFTSANGSAVRDLRITATASTTGAGISVSATTGFRISNVKIDACNTSLSTSGACNQFAIDGNCIFTTPAATATARALSITDTSNFTITGGIYQASGGTYAMEIFGTCNGVAVSGAEITGSTGGSSAAVRFDAALSSLAIAFSYNRTLSTYFFSFGNSTDPSNFYNVGNGSDYQVAGILSGAHGTVDRGKGNTIKFDATTTGSAYLIDVPTPAGNRATSPLTMLFYNHAGGAVTGWTLNASGYKTTAAIPTTDAHIITVKFEWDSANSIWREVSRADTAL